MPTPPLALLPLDELLLQGGVALLYLVFVVLTALALALARWVKARGNLQLQAGLLSPLGSLYTLTTAFLLSNGSSSSPTCARPSPRRWSRSTSWGR